MPSIQASAGTVSEVEEATNSGSPTSQKLCLRPSGKAGSRFESQDITLLPHICQTLHYHSLKCARHTLTRQFILLS